MSSVLRIAAVSTGPADGGLSAALDDAGAHVARAAREGAHLVVLPELFALPYTAGEDPHLWPVIGETSDGTTARWASAQAVRHSLDIVFGLPLATDGRKPLNAGLLARADGSVSIVATKHHLPPPATGERFGETDHFQRGDDAVACFTLGGVHIAVLICYDRRIPDRWHAAVRADADLVLVLVAGPAPQDPDGFYLSELSGHAWAHTLHVIAAARSGTEMLLGRPVRHDGVNAAIDPSGVVRAHGEGIPGEILHLDLDTGEIARRRAERHVSTLQTATHIS